jgi:nucleoid-associated protein YgaU
MMDPAVKTAMAFCVVLAGVCAAMLFRHDRPRLTPPNMSAEEELLLRSRADAPTARFRTHGRSTSDMRGAQVATTNPPPATVVTPLGRRESPPSLSSDYPAADRPANSRWGASMEMMLPVAKPVDDTTRTHRVVDGDTLAALAERYLGSAARADEIFQANRDVLQNPGLLPIGAELKLPPRNRESPPPATPSSSATPQGSLAPVR